MGNHYTRVVRIYSKLNFSDIDIEHITKKIVSTATMSDLCYYVNIEENCLDIKFCSKRAGGEIDLDFDKFDVWEIRQNEIFHNELKYEYEAVTFGFDEIHFESSNEILNEEFFKYFMKLKKSGLAVEKNGVLIIKEKGSYHTDIMYDIEFNDSGERIRSVNLDEFIRPREYGGMVGVLENKDLRKDLGRFYFFMNNPHDPEVFKLYDGFNSIKFFWKGRVVNVDYKSELYWSEGLNSDWWDNCLLPEWIQFRNERIQV